MKQDIESREDIEQLMEAFYSKAFPDPVIGHFFTRVMQLDLEQHLPVIADFWESILMNKPALYKRNAMQPHLHLHAKSPMTHEHLQRWLALFNATLDSMFEGDRAELARQRAASIATVMEIKMYELKNNGS
jgi:hemoglobin